ncbi:glucan biosynthesis protein [Benzoatithermus flavus]|uniref:Glucan biosynthesis protein D n=1 Tax=Benzoatithermus flavus TaxID=3108223 RepID=A0ABU8XSW5_9PROT
MPLIKPVRRRAVLQSAAGTIGSLPFLPMLHRAALAADPSLDFGPAEPFSFELLIDRARRMAAKEYVPPPRPAPEVVQRIDYDAHGKLRFKPEYALFGDGPGIYPATFQFLGGFFPKSVRMYAVEGGEAREIRYRPEYFTIRPDSPARELPPDANGFAGVWFHESRLEGDWQKREPWATFLGASYFRAIGELGQVGMSARGVALNVASGTPEEFPDFVAHWISPAVNEGDPVILHSLLDGPSICGAYRFKLYRTRSVLMEIEKHLFLRKDIERLGIAPLTSMFWYGEYGREKIADWRPEVHDSDGLAIWNGAGERLWRPLNNPTRIFHTSYLDNNPKGYGLIQRDRNFDHYLDGVGYDRRPSTWVEPIGDWGKGMVQLVEIPTDDEIHDNIGAYWLSERPTKAGDALAYSYKLHWVDKQPYFPWDQLAHVSATRMGRGGQPGKPRPRGVYKFQVEFLGGKLGELPFGVLPEPVIWVSRGTTSLVLMEAVPDNVPGHWRLFFDLTVDGEDPVDMRVFLKQGDKLLSENWIWLFEPRMLKNLWSA